MTSFTPPVPPLLPRKASLWQYFRIGLRSAISMGREGSYDTLSVGRVRLPSLPGGKQRSLYLVRPFELLREVLVGRAEEFPKSRLMGTMLDELLGDGIFTSNGETWKRQRRMMDPAFEGARIKDAFAMMRNAADAAIERLAAHVAGSGAGQPVMMDVETTHFTADVIFRTIYSEPIAKRTAHDIFEAFEVFQKIGYAHGFLRLIGIPAGLLPGARRGARAARAIRERLKRPLDARLEQARQGEAPERHDILASLMEAVDPVSGTRFDEGELLDQIAMLFLAGHETSASTLAWACYLLANCPHLQDRIHEEAEAVYGGRAPEFSDMKKLAFARDVVRETLRLYPPVAFVARDSTKAEQFENRSVAPGEVVVVPLWLLHRNRGLWQGADQFDPDRFSGESDQEAIRCAYIPFSMGPRVCVGAAFAMQETALFLSLLCRQFRLKPKPGHTPLPVSRLTLRSLNGMPLVVEPR